MRRLVVLICLFFVLPAYSNIYQWTDKQGEVHFSDVPHKGAKVIELPDTQTFTPPKQNLSIKPTKETSTVKKRSYTIVAITRPVQEATIRNNQGFVAISVELEPSLAKTDQLQFYLDGEKVGKPQQALVFTLYDIYRGAHSVHVEIIDSEGKVIGRSEEVTFYMHRPRVGMGSRVQNDNVTTEDSIAPDFVSSSAIN